MIRQVVHTIADFQVGFDIIAFSGLGLSSKDIILSQSGADTLIQAFGKDLAVLLGVQATSLNAGNFVFT